MKKLMFIMIAVALGLSTQVSPAAALDVEGNAYVGVFDKYLWRGLDLSNSQPVAQGGIDVSANGFTLGFWSNVQLSDGNSLAEGIDWLPSNEVTETDIYIDYTHEFGPVAVSVGNIFYNFNAAAASTHELYLGLALDTILSPSVTVYYDWDIADEVDMNGFYYAIGISHGFDLGKAMSLGLNAAANYNDESPYVGDYSEWHNYELGIGLDYALSDQLLLSASYLYSTPISDEAKDLLDDESVAGLTVTLTF